MENIDEADRRILALLQRDAGRSLEEISEIVNLSRNAVWRRIRAMETSGLIRGRVALVEPERLGLGLTVFMFIRTDRHEPDWLDRFQKAVKSVPEILGAYRMTGDLDYLIRARVRDVKDYDRLYQRLTAQVPLADVSASFVMEELRETTELPL